MCVRHVGCVGAPIWSAPRTDGLSVDRSSVLVSLTRFERVASAFGGRRSFLLSYRDKSPTYLVWVSSTPLVGDVWGGCRDSAVSAACLSTDSRTSAVHFGTYLRSDLVDPGVSLF